MITTQYGKVAGSSYSILWLAIGLHDLGHMVTIATPKNSFLAKMALENGLHLFPIDFRSQVDLFAARKIALYIKKNHTEIVYAQESRDRYVSILAKIIYRLEVKIVLARRQRIADNHAFKRWVHQSFSSKIIVVSNGLKVKMIQKGFDENHLQMIHNGIPLHEFTLERRIIDELRNRYHISTDQLIIGCVARLKRQDVLIEAIRLLPINYKLLLVGINEDECKKAFPTITISPEVKDRIIFTGEIVNRKEVLAHYALMHVHVLPSQMDGFGLVSAEAMAMGIPAIGSNYGGIPDVIQQGISGFIFENDDVIDLVKKIEMLHSNQSVRKQIIQNASKIVMDRFDISITVNNYERYFLELLKQKDRP